MKSESFQKEARVVQKSEECGVGSPGKKTTWLCSEIGEDEAQMPGKDSRTKFDWQK